MHIILIGFKGSGKTTIGRNLAQILGLSLIDTDDLIIKRYQEAYVPEALSISNIYKDLGDLKFRQVESEIIKELPISNTSIIATGGGTILDCNNVAFFKSIGYSFFLDISYLSLIARMSKNKIMNNLFLGSRKDEINIMNIFNSRYGIYHSAADFIIKVDDLNESMITNKIIQLWRAIVSVKYLK
jgi:shikimate kinase